MKLKSKATYKTKRTTDIAYNWLIQQPGITAERLDDLNISYSLCWLTCSDYIGINTKLEELGNYDVQPDF